MSTLYSSRDMYEPDSSQKQGSNSNVEKISSVSILLTRRKTTNVQLRRKYAENPKMYM